MACKLAQNSSTMAGITIVGYMTRTITIITTYITTEEDILGVGILAADTTAEGILAAGTMVEGTLAAGMTGAAAEGAEEMVEEGAAD